MGFNRVIFDEQVLAPRLLRGAMLALAEPDAELYKPGWSPDTLDRLARIALPTHGVGIEAAAQIVNLLQQWPGALEAALPPPQFELRGLSVKQVDILAFATEAGGDLIVTPTPGDYPRAHLTACGVDGAASPDTFLKMLFFKGLEDIPQLLAHQLAVDYPGEGIRFSDFFRELAIDGVVDFPFVLAQYVGLPELEARLDMFLADPTWDV